MKKAYAITPFFLLLALFSVCPVVYAPETVDLANFPTLLATALNISTFAGNLLASMIFMLMFILPVAIFTKTVYPPIFIGILCLGFCIGVGWLNYWFLLVLCVMIALMFAGRMGKTIGGR